MKPILFLDIDGVLWQYSDVTPIPAPADGLKDFWSFATGHFDIYWLTAWMINRTVVPKDVAINLWKHTDIPVEDIMACPVAPWREYKDEGVRAVIGDTDRQWAWVEDELMHKEIEWLVDTDNMWRYIFCDVFEDKDSLIKATGNLKIVLDRISIVI